jgi:peptidoglycan/LPS O-acetylase OafA/YrhL
MYRRELSLESIENGRFAVGRSLPGRIRRRVIDDLFSPPSGQLDALNGLRGIGCLLVLAHHVASFSGNLSSGPNNAERLDGFFQVINTLWIGVDIFFVISGFLIGRILMNNISRRGSVEFPRFFLRRAMRVFPAFYLVLTLAVFWYTRLDIPHSQFLLVGPGGWGEMLQNSWVNYTYVMNYTFHTGSANPMGWTWTLCVEEHFYLLLPPLLVVLYRSPRSWVVPAGLIAFIVLPIVGRAIQYSINPDLFQMDGFFFQTHNRVDEMMIGVLIAYLFVHHPDKLKSFVERAGSLCWITAVVILIIVGVYGGINRLGMFPVVFQYFLVAFAIALLIVNGLFLDNRATWIMTNRKPYLIARVSYGIYLLHPYVLFVVLGWHGAFPEPSALTTAQFILLYGLTLTGTTLIAAVMFVCFERPMIDLGARWTDRKPEVSPVTASAEGVKG